LDNILSAFSDTDLAVVTDAEGILGIGDQGFGGIAICMGKLSLYSLTAGINPVRSLPVILDFGTDNKKLLEDPFYLGVRKPRVRGAKYFEMVDAFIDAWRKRFPNALLQWEDLSKSTAFDALARYREKVPSFNDDIQGTGAMALAGLLAATEQGKTLKEQVFLVSGAGAGGIGVAQQVRNGLVRLGMSAAEAHKRIFVLDSRGLILDDREGLEDYKKEFAHRRSDLAQWEFSSKNPNLLETIFNAKVTVLLGLSGQGASFDQKIIEAVLKNTKKPIVFALSNPTNLTEIMPEDAIAWTDGQVWMATGSPFPAVTWKGKQHIIGQGNNTFVFPGIGWGVAASGARTVEAEMMTDASFALASQVTPERLASGAVFPPIADLMKVTDHVARAVAESAMRIGVATVSREQMDKRLSQRDWTPEYANYELDAS
jgi:malate dehydrogenase (oxaloacetate-decarboxylating)